MNGTSQMPARERSGGVTAAAVVVFMGSGFTFLMGLLTCFAIFLGPPLPQTGTPLRGATDLMGSLIIAVVFYFLLAGWGTATGVGLLKLKAWARMSLLVFSGFCTFTMIFAAIGIALIGPFLPQTPGAPPFAVVRGLLIAMIAVPLLIAVWWLVYFNREGVKGQFEEYATTGHYSRTDGSAQTLFLKPHPPLSIVLIGCMYLFSVPGLLLMPFRSQPAFLMGLIIHGAAAKVIYLLYLAAALYVGIGLLKLKPPARILAMALCAFHSVNSLAFALLPGLEERITDLLGSAGVVLPPQLAAGIMTQLIRIGAIAGLGLTALILWVLVTRKNVFEAAAARA